MENHLTVSDHRTLIQQVLVGIEDMSIVDQNKYPNLQKLIPELYKAIQIEDVRTIQGIKGIGAKTAQRVIIDLKGKVLKFSSSSENIFSQSNTNRFDALTALVSLGFDKKSAEKVLDKIDTGEQTVEVLIKEALRLL
jgi:Holliday junction DNA helicase RuvA